MRMEWLEDILLVAETGSFSAAADRRGLTKSAFSRRLRHIEQQLGVELFDRTSKPARLHPSIMAQREGILGALGLVNEVVRDLQNSEKVAHEVIRIGTTPSLSLTKVPGLTDLARQALPQISVRVFARGRDDVIGMLLARSVDIAVVPRLEGWRDTLVSEVVETADVGTDQLIAYRSCEISKENLIDGTHQIPVVLYPSDTFFRQVLEHRVLPSVRRKAQLVPIAETGSTIGLMGYIAHGFGVGWLPESLVAWCSGTKGFQNLSSELPSESLTLSVVRLRERNSSAQLKVWEAMISSPERS